MHNDPSMAIRFRGLCALVPREGACDAYWLAQGGRRHEGHGCKSHVPHRAVLVASADEIEFDDSTWQPDLLTSDPDGKAIAVWLLEKNVLSLLQADASGRRPRVRRRPDVDVLDLMKFHTAVGDTPALASRDSILKSGAGLCILSGGSLCIPRHKPTDLKVLYEAPNQKTKGKPREKTIESGTYAEAIQWAGRASGLQDQAGRRIIVKAPDDEQPGPRRRYDAMFSLTNLAEVPDRAGLAHFTHYYDTLHGSRGTVRVTNSVFTIWDCVPPMLYVVARIFAGG